MAIACPLCGGKWPDHHLREDGNIFANDLGHVVFVGVRLTIFRAAQRPGGVTMKQATEITGTSPSVIKSEVCQVNKHELSRIGKKLVNVTGRGDPDARYVLHEED